MSVESPRKRRDRYQVALIGSVGLVVALPVGFVSAFFSVLACIGSDGAGVSADSPRGQICDVPRFGAWAYVIVVGVAAISLWTPYAVKREWSGRLHAVIATVVVVSGSLLLVPLFLSLFART